MSSVATEREPILEPGQQLGPYTLMAPLGRGGTGEVWRAEDELSNPVALKVPRRPAFVRHLRQEGLFLAQLEHPNVAKFVAADLEADPPWLATELVNGTPLRALCRGTIDAAQATLLCDQLLAGLDAIHAAGILHLDLKPENVIVQPDGQLKIVDLGLGHATTKFMEEVYLSVSLVSRVPPVAGTLAYMAPEQRRGKQVDCRSDLFAFGILLHELLTGCLPEPGVGVLDLRPQLAPRWDTAVARLTHPNPAARPQTAKAARHMVAFTLAQKCTTPNVVGGVEPRDLTAFDEEAFALVSPYSAGMVIGEGYELVSLLGRGGFGEVWEARRGGDEEGEPERVAIKLALAPEAEAGLRREAEIAQRIDHPGVPRVIQDQTSAHPPHIVLELVEGTSLRLTIHEERQLPMPTVLSVFRGMLDVVRACEQAEVVHMDLKPEHFLVDWRVDEARVSLIDFGLAAHLPEAELRDSLSSRAEIRGTLDYMAPEQRAGSVSTRADVYALGVCCFELLTLGLPKGPQRPRTIRREVPQELDDLVVSMLDRDPFRRPSLQEALARVSQIQAATAFIPVRGVGVRVSWGSTLRYRLKSLLLSRFGVAGFTLACALLVLLFLFLVPQAIWRVRTRAFKPGVVNGLCYGDYVRSPRIIDTTDTFPGRRGKVLIVTYGVSKARVNKGWADLPSELRATSPQEVSTLIRVKRLGKRVGLQVVDRTTGLITADYRLDSFPEFTFKNRSTTITEWVEAMPPHTEPQLSAEERERIQREETAALDLLRKMHESLRGRPRGMRSVWHALRARYPDAPQEGGAYKFRLKSKPHLTRWVVSASPSDKRALNRHFAIDADGQLYAAPRRIMATNTVKLPRYAQPLDPVGSN